MSGIPTLETERLRLRAFRLEDAAEVQRLAGDRAIAATTLHVSHPYEDGMAEEWIARHEADFADGKGVTFAITGKADGSLVGAMSLMGVAGGHQAELGYWIGLEYWGKGFCTEAAAAVLRYAFAELGLARVHAAHFARNPASGRVMQKLGMQLEGRRRQHVKKWGKYDDSVIYGILREEWLKAGNELSSPFHPHAT